MAKASVNFVAGIVMAIVLAGWIGLDFWSWKFWGPFAVLSLTEALACVLYAEFDQ